MKKKKSIIANSVIAATVATSVFAVTSPVDAASASAAVTKAEKAVVKAEKLGGTLKWEISVEYRKAKYPKNVVGYPNMKLFNDTKKALADARTAIKALSGKNKEVLSARLDANVQLHVNRAIAYIDAVSSGTKILNKGNELNGQVAKGIVDDKTEQLYHAVNAEIKKNSYILDRVYGATTRALFRDFYKQTAVNQVNALLYPLTIKIELDRANAALKASNLDEAATRLGNATYFVKEAAVKKGQAATSKLIVGALAKQQAVKAAFESKAVLFTANYGPATGSETIGKTVYVYVGADEQLTLQNVSIDGNLVILGSPAGGGSVYLENVKVNKGTNAGKIIVKNVADHSLVMKNVVSDGVQVDDKDGYRIVFDQGSKTNNLTVSQGAGATGKGTIESKESGTVGTLNIASNKTNQSQGTELVGDFSTTNITVSGNNAELNLSTNTKTDVGSIDFKAPASVTVPQGSTVGQMTKSTDVQGNVNVVNNGTITKADNNIEVGGTNKPVETTTPSAGTSPVLTVYKAVMKSGKEVSGSNFVVDLTNQTTLPGSEIFTGVKVDGNNTVKLLLNSLVLQSEPTKEWIGAPVPFTINGETLITTQQLFGALDTGEPGISMSALRDTFKGETLVLKGYLENASGVQSAYTITIKF